MGASIEAQLLATKPNMNKGKGKKWPLTFTIAEMPTRDDLSYLPPHMLY